MNINRVTLAGYTGKNARTTATQNGRSMTKLSIATSKRYKDSDGNWQEKTQWHTCVSYGPTADYAAKIQTGSYVCRKGPCIPSSASADGTSRLNQSSSTAQFAVESCGSIGVLK